MKRKTYNFSMNALVGGLIDQLCAKTGRNKSETVEDSILAMARKHPELAGEARRIAEAKALLRGEKSA